MGTLTCVLLILIQLVVSHKDTLTDADLDKNTHTRNVNVWLLTLLSAVPRWAKVLRDACVIIKTKRSHFPTLNSKNQKYICPLAGDSMQIFFSTPTSFNLNNGNFNSLELGGAQTPDTVSAHSSRNSSFKSFLWSKNKANIGREFTPAADACKFQHETTNTWLFSSDLQLGKYESWSAECGIQL